VLPVPEKEGGVVEPVCSKLETTTAPIGTLVSVRDVELVVSAYIPAFAPLISMPPPAQLPEPLQKVNAPVKPAENK
jgi:hypothetical protein